MSVVQFDVGMRDERLGRRERGQREIERKGWGREGGERKREREREHRNHTTCTYLILCVYIYIYIIIIIIYVILLYLSHSCSDT